MTDLARLVTRLEAETSKYQSELERARVGLRRYERDTNETARNIGKAAGVMLAAGATAAAAMVKSAIDAQDELSKLSRSTGVSVEALSELQYVAKMSGVDDLGQSLNKLNKSIGDAATGSKEQIDAFSALGVSVVDSNGKLRDTESVLNDVADAFAKYADGPAKASIAMNLFGKSGADLISFLDDGSEGLRKGREEAAKFGLTVRNDAAKSAEQFNDDLSRLQSVTTGVANQVAQGLTPTLSDLTDQMVAWASESENVERLTRSVDVAVKGFLVTAIGLKSIAMTIGTSFGAIAAAFSRLEDGVSNIDYFIPGVALFKYAMNVGDAYQVLSGAYTDMRDSVSNDIEAILNIINAGQKKIADAAAPETPKNGGQDKPQLKLPNTAGASDAKRINDLSAELSLLNRQLELMSSGMDAATASEQAQMEAASGTQLAILQTRSEIEKLTDSQSKRLAAEQELIQQADSLKTSLMTPNEQYERQIALIDTLYNGKYIDAETRTRALVAASDDLYRALDSQDKAFESASSELNTYADEAARNIQSAFADFLFDPFDQGLKGMLEGFAQTIQRMIAEAASAAILKQIFGTGGIEGAIGGAIGSIFGGGVTTHADGSDIQPGWNLLGERGPELVYSGSRASVYDAEETSAMRGSKTVNQTFYVSTPDPNAFRSSERQILRRARGALA